MGDVMWQNATCTWSYWTVPSSFLHGSLVLEHHLFLVLQRLARDGILGPCILIALQIHLRFGEQVLVAFQRALRLGELRLIRPGIDIDQRIAFVNCLPLAVMHGRDHARDLRGNGVGIHRRDRADGVEINADAAFRAVATVTGTGPAIAPRRPPAAGADALALCCLHTHTNRSAKSSRMITQIQR